MNDPSLAAYSAPHFERHPAPALADLYQPVEVDSVPPLALRAVCVELVVMLAKPGDAAQINHPPMLLRGEAHRMSASD